MNAEIFNKIMTGRLGIDIRANIEGTAVFITATNKITGRKSKAICLDEAEAQVSITELINNVLDEPECAECVINV